MDNIGMSKTGLYWNKDMYGIEMNNMGLRLYGMGVRLT